jgi:hypothetical protein
VRAVEEMTREQQPAVTRRQHWWPWAVAVVLGGAVLMFCYLRVAGATEVNSDAAGLVLQASDMLHGNLLLHGWWDTDVSFITTELPEYMGVTAVAGVRPEVVHICAALTYTLLVLLAAFVARGRSRGAEGVVRALLAAWVMLAPQPSGPTPVLLGSPDHVGTAVPILLLMLLLDRATDLQARARSYIADCACICICTAVLLAATIVGDALAEVVGVVPLVLACLLRAVRIIVVRINRAWHAATGDPPAADTSWRAVLYHLSLAAAAVAAVPLAGWANSLILRHGGYQLGPNLYGRLPWHAVVQNAPVVWQSILALFGADVAGVTGLGNVVFALAHLTGVAVVIAAVAFAAWRLLVPARAARAGDLVADFLVLAVLVNVAAYLFFVQPVNIYSAHEIGPVVSFGAALAGRMLGGPLLQVRRDPQLSGPPWPRQDRQRHGTPVLAPVLAAEFVVYAALLGIAAAHPQGPPQNVGLATWLSQHHLGSGLASYWEASSVTVDSGGKVTMLAIGIHGWNRRLAPDQWETDVRLDNPATHSANFVVVGPDRIVPAKLADEMFGQPARTYHYAQYTIMVWNKNLIGELNPI